MSDELARLRAELEEVELAQGGSVAAGEGGVAVGRDVQGGIRLGG